MKKSMVFVAITACVLTACNKKADEATPKTVTENATEVVANAEATVEEAVKPAEEKVEVIEAKAE